MALFTAENAAAMQARAQAAMRRKRDAAMLATAEPQEAPQSPEAAAIQRIEKQIERLNNLLDKSSDARDIDKLTVSLHRLHERRRIMLGIPLPGSIRPSRKPARFQPAPLMAIELDPPTELGAHDGQPPLPPA